ncbi:MAG: transcriptional regulator NrdR [Oscillospiraceae bacterium]|nr:transcriptional regulator NrdR [Oscillospiraceae bacterium]
MKCPYCSLLESRVIDSRPAEEGATIRRRRECLKCAKRFTTYEIIERIPIVVSKRDGSREQFDKQKLLNGMLRACANRPVTLTRLQEITDDIEMTLQNSLENEIPTERIGELVMDSLKTLDEVSYVRFASVYRHFTDINSFMVELNKLISTPEKKD